VNDPALVLPPYRVIRKVLRDVTERLAREIDSPQRAAPHWSVLEWRMARAAAALQGISTLLANRLRWRGPDDWHAFLAQQRSRSVERDQCIDALLARLDAALRDAGVGCVALKGAALRRLPFYLPGERPMGDVDLLANRAEAPRVSRAVCAAGYVHVADKDRETIFEPVGMTAAIGFGEHPATALKVELHVKIAEMLPVRVVDISAGLFPETLSPGLNPYRDIRALMHHLLLHAAGNIRAHAVRQIQLHDIALLARELTASHWRQLLAGCATGCWWMLPPLALTARYYADSIPLSVLDGARACCPPLLRAASTRMSLSQVSWSNLRIAAFPGIAWSNSPLEALRFVRSRVAPGRHALAELEVACRLMPTLQQQPWYGEKHLVRIARWIFTRPPRVQTMISVRAALSGDAA